MSWLMQNDENFRLPTFHTIGFFTSRITSLAKNFIVLRILITKQVIISSY